jgi:hypothetical protein
MGKASKLFFSTDNERETLYSRIVPTEDHTAFLQENWNKRSFSVMNSRKSVGSRFERGSRVHTSLPL